MKTQAKGKLGEEIAVKYLLKNNYKILKQNYYTRWGEIDIIAWDKKDDELVFVEVKARSSQAYGHPESAVDEYKLEKMIATAEKYLNQAGYNQIYRFDCLAVELDYNYRKAQVRHYKNIS